MARKDFEEYKKKNEPNRYHGGAGIKPSERVKTASERLEEKARQVEAQKRQREAQAAQVKQYEEKAAEIRQNNLPLYGAVGGLYNKYGLSTGSQIVSDNAKRLEQREMQKQLAHATEMSDTYAQLYGSSKTNPSQKAEALEQRKRFDREAWAAQQRLDELGYVEPNSVFVPDYTELPMKPGFDMYAELGADMETDIRPEEIEGSYTYYDLLSDEEQGVFNYLLATQGEESAQNYMDFMRNTAQHRYGQRVAQGIEESDWRTGALIANSLGTGVTNWMEGMLGAYGAATGQEVAENGLNYASPYIKENLGTVGNVAYDLGVTVGNMLPSVMLGGAAGNVSMGLSAGGNAYQQGIREGMSNSEALVYGTLIGTSEAYLQRAIGGINRLSSAKASKLDDALRGIENGFLRFISKTGVGMVKEGGEEALQAVLEPMFNSLITGSDVDIDWSEVAYNALMGALVGGVFEAPQNLVETTLTEGKDAMFAPTAEKPQNLASEGVVPIGNNVPAEARNAAEIRPDSPGLAQAREQQTKDGNYGYGEYGNTAFEQVMTDFALDADSARTVFQTAYEAGRLDTDRAKVELANPIQERAFEAGKKDYVMSRKDAANGTETVHLREGGQRLGGQNIHGQIRSVEESAGRNQRGQTQSGIADSETASLTYGRKVSTASLGIGGGSRIANIRVVTGGDTTATRAARQLAKARGLRVIFFEGNNLEIHRDSGEKVSARAYITGDRVFIRVDHAEYTADQLMRHEAGHDMIAKGEVDISEVRRRIDRTFGKEKTGQLADMYAEAYEGTGMSAEEIWEEVVCDSLGDMNIFSETANEANAWELLQQTKTASIETQIEGIRGPPTEGKASIANLPDGKKYVRAERQVVFGNDPDAWSEQLEDYINGKIRRGEDVKLVAADGDILTLTADTAGKVASPYKGAARMSDEAFERKVSAGSHIDELAQASVRGKRNAKDENAKHGDMAAGGWNYRTAYFLDFDNTYYECTISVSIGKQGNAVYNIGEMKKRSFPTVPKALTGSSADSGAQRGKASVDTNVSQGETKVNSRLNSHGKKLSDKQADYFAESKVRDADGRLKVMYRGGTEDFTVFDRKKSRYSNLYGRGFYFTDSESHARQYGNAREFYLDIKNPVSTDMRTIKKSQMLAFLEAVAENEDDYSFENYGYGASPESVLRSVFSGKSDFAMLYDVSQTAIGDMVEAVELFNEVNGTDFDGLILDTETVTFSSEQAKYVSNLAPTSDPDVRYSRDLETIKEMREDNAQMRQANEELEKLFRSGTIAKLDKKTLSTFAKDIVKGAGSSMSVAEVTERLRSLHNYLIAGEDGSRGNWDSAYEQSYEIAAEILENATTTDDSMYQQYRELRDTIRNTGISISREYDGDMVGYESINDFRKANFGRIKIVKDGRPVDSFYEELAESYPEFFDSTEHANPADQLNHIAEVLDSLRPFESNPFSYNMKEASAWLANDIMMRFYRVQNEKLADTIQKGKDKALRARRREIAKRDEKIKKLKEKQRAKERKMSESRKARILRTKIQRHIAPMKQKLLRPSDKQHVPQELREAVAAMLDAINLESGYDYVPGSQHQTSRNATVGKHAEKGSGDPTKRTEEFVKVREIYQKIISKGNDADMVIDPALIGGEGNRSMLDEIIAMRDIPLASMNVAQLQTVWDCVRTIEYSISEAGKTFAKSKFETTKAFADAFVADTATRRAIDRDKAADKRAKDLETPYTFFSRYGNAGMEFYRALRNAQDAEQVMQDELAQRVAIIVSSEQKKKLEKETKEFTTVSGDKLTLSKAHIMEIYLLNKRDQARGHLTAGGIVQPKAGKVKRGTEPTLLTEVDVAKIIGSLTEEEQKIADGLQQLTLWLAEKGNEASMKVYGYEKFGDPNYWTIRSANEQIAQTVEKNRDNPRAIANMGSAKPLTPNATNALDISGVFDTFSRHSSDMLTYSAWLATMEDANRLFNYKFKDAEGKITGKNMQTLLNKVGGAASTNYWLELMKDIQNGIQNPADTGIEGVAKKIVANTKKASVSANIRVVVQQPTAIARATAVLNPAYLTAALGKSVTVKRAFDGWKKAVKYAPIASRKAAGGYEVSSNPKQLADLLYRPTTKKGKTAEGVKEAPLWLAGEADKFTWGTIWNACQMQVSAKNKDLSDDVYYKKVTELFTEVIDQTQVVDGVLQRSQAMRSGSALMQQMTSFTGEPTMAANMVIRAYDNVRREQDIEKRRTGRKALARTVGAYILTAGLNAFVQSIVDAMRDDEEDEKFWKKVNKHMWGITGKEEKRWDRIRNVLLAGNAVNNLNPLTWIPILKDVVSIVQGYSVERMDAASISDFLSDAELAVKSLSGEGKYTSGYALTKAFASAGKILGIPVANLIRDIESVIDTIYFASDDVEGMYEIERLISTIPNNKSRYAELAYMAYAQGDMELHERIRQDMIAAGVEDGYIKTAIENHMKKAYGVNDVKLLPQRYMTPEQQKSYNAVMDKVEKSDVWKKADARVQKNVSYDYYEVATGATSAQSMVDKMEMAAKYGIDSVEFLLYEAALGMADKPNDGGNYGTYTNAEIEEALNAVPGLSRAEKSDFWEEVLDKSEKNNPWG